MNSYRVFLSVLCSLYCHWLLALTPEHAINGDLNDQLATIMDEQSAKTSSQIIRQVLNIEGNEALSLILAKVASKTQQPGERWSFNAFEMAEKDKAITYFKDLGFIHALYPKKNHYDYLFITGCTYSAFTKRLAFFTQLHNEGIRFNEVFILTGPRLLQPFEQDVLPAHIKTEEQMVNYAIHELNITKLTGITPQVIDSFIQPGYFRARTATTIQSWIALNKADGHILSIMSQPEVYYQHAVIHYYLSRSKKHYTLESVGPEMNPIQLNRVVSAFSKWLNWSYSDVFGPK